MNLSLKQFKAVIFDLDGTLVDSVPDISLALNHALTGMKLPSVSEDQVRLWIGNGSRKLMERCLQADNMQVHNQLDIDGLNVSGISIIDEFHKSFLTSYKQFLCTNSKLYPGVLELLGKLKQQNIPMGLVTNKPIEFVPKLLSLLNIDDYFESVIGGDSLAEKKPSSMPLIYTAAQLGIDVKDCLMVGDSSSDVLSAQAASMPCVLLRQGYNQGQDLAALKPDWLLDNINDLLICP